MYEKTHTLFTNILNELLDALLPVSVFKFPKYFQYPDDIGVTYANSTNDDLMLHAFSMLDVPIEQKYKYHYIWLAYQHGKVNFTMFCLNHENNCSTILGFKLLDEKGKKYPVCEKTNNKICY